jgi:hypothetical protein
MGLILPSTYKPKCDHHWHQGTSDGREGEIKTSSPPWWPVHCCKCGENNHARTDGYECVKANGPAVHVRGILRNTNDELG